MDEKLYLGCKVIWNDINNSYENESEDDDSLASVDSVTISIFCGNEERIKLHIDISAGMGESEFQSIGKFGVEDEVSVVLAADTIESHSVLDKISVPVICLDKTKPSDLTLEELDHVFTITFKILPPPPSDCHEQEGTSSSRRQGATTEHKIEKNAVKDSVKGEIRPIGSSPSRIPNNLSVRLSDVYLLIRGLITALGTNLNRAVYIVETIHSLTKYIFDKSRIVLSIALDIGLEGIHAIDSAIFQSLSAFDDTLSLYREAIVNCLQAIFDRLKVDIPQIEQSAQGLLADIARPWIRCPIRWTKPLLHFAINTSQPVYAMAKPFLVDPHIDKVLSVRNRFVSYPIIGKAWIETEKIVNFTWSEVVDELDMKQN